MATNFDHTLSCILPLPSFLTHPLLPPEFSPLFYPTKTKLLSISITHPTVYQLLEL